MSPQSTSPKRPRTSRSLFRRQRPSRASWSPWPRPARWPCPGPRTLQRSWPSCGPGSTPGSARPQGKDGTGTAGPRHLLVLWAWATKAGLRSVLGSSFHEVSPSPQCRGSPFPRWPGLSECSSFCSQWGESEWTVLFVSASGLKTFSALPVNSSGAYSGIHHRLCIPNLTECQEISCLLKASPVQPTGFAWVT